jgi:hypothetical protein
MLATDGENFDSFESMRRDWPVGDEFIGHSNTRWRATAVIPGERIDEFIDGPQVDGLLEVEPR